ncbi:MAG: WG repeat-containing protein [Alistipes sp.]|nr:WG repeat-containing protein [Alistipes sp.]
MKRLTQIFQALLGVVALILTAIIAFGRLAWRTIRNWWKNRSKWLRRSIAAIFIVVPVGFVALVAYLLYEDKYGRDYYDRRLSDNITLHSFANNKWRVYDRTIGEYVTDKVNWLSDVSENDSLAVYALPGKRGYINVNNGRIVIDAEANSYTKAWVFSEGLAAVVKDGKIGFINAQNEVVIPFQFDDYASKCRMWQFGYVFHNGYCAMPNANGDLGLIDKGGNWVVEPSYDEIWAPHESGYRVIVKDGKHGVLDSSCNVVYPAEYLYVGITRDGFVLTKGGRRWQVDFEGNTTQPFMFDIIDYLKYPNGYDSNGELTYEFADFVKYEIMNSYGIMNRITGEPITPAIYSDIIMLSKDLFEVQKYDSYDWYLLDAKGNVVSKR